MIQYLWNHFLFQPIFNLLIFLYNNFSYFNFGIAVMYLTLIIRILLLPLSITSHRGREFYKKLSEKVQEIDKDYGSDYIKKKEIVKDFLKKNKVHPWSRAIVLGVQLLVLILLYQVFIGGLNTREKFSLLYPFVSIPDYINPNFLWFELSERNWFISALAGFALFCEILLAQRNRKEILSRRDQWFKILFPLFTIAALGILPSVKSVFILTSIIFSIIIILMNDIIMNWSKLSQKKKEAKKPHMNLNDITIKRI